MATVVTKAAPTTTHHHHHLIGTRKLWGIHACIYGVLCMYYLGVNAIVTCEGVKWLT